MEQKPDGMPEANVEEKLGKLTYKPDHNPHIRIENVEVCRACKDKPCLSVCPAKVYSWEEKKKEIVVSYENCMECGAFRILCPYGNIKGEWPRGGFGVQYKYG